MTQARTLVRHLLLHEKLYHVNDLTMQVGIPLPVLTATVRQFAVRFRMAEDNPLVTAQLLALLEQGYSAQVHATTAEAWATLNRDMSRPFDKSTSGCIAVKVINHLGDEMMKVLKVR